MSPVAYYGNYHRRWIRSDKKSQTSKQIFPTWPCKPIKRKQAWKESQKISERERRVMRQHAAGKSPESESTGRPVFVSATEVQ